VRIKKKLFVSALASVGALALAALPAGHAMASGSSPSGGLTSFRQLAVAGNHAFLTGAPDSGSGIVVTGLSGNLVTTLDKGASVAGIALKGSTLFARLTSGSEAGSLAAIGIPSGGSASFTQHFISLLDGVLPAGLGPLASALGLGTAPAGAGKANVSASGARATGSGSAIDVYGSDGRLANVIDLGAATLAQGGLAWAGTTLVAVTKNADGLYGVRSFLDAALRDLMQTVAPAAPAGATGHSPVKTATPAHTGKRAPTAVSAPVRASATGATAPKMSLGMTGWYASTPVSGTTYREYQHAGDIDVNVDVSPGKTGECVWFEGQEYYGGAWHANMKGSCAALNPGGKLSGYLAVSSADPGYHYRIRAHYLPSGSDTGNAASATGWQYLIVSG